MTINFSNFSLKGYIIIKIIEFLIISFFGMCLYKILAAKDENYRKYFKYFLIYFVPVFIILILIWPGVWYGYDQIDLIELSKTVTFGTWLNYLTSVFYSLGLTLFPVTSGAIILQLILMSITVGYIVKNSMDIFKSKKCYILYVPFFLPVTIFYTLYANRPITNGILYLLLISIWIFDYLKKNKLTKSKFILLCLLIGIVGNWRSETIYLIFAGPLFVFLSYNIKVNIKNIFKVCIPVIVSFMLIMFPQKYLTRNQSFVESSSRNLTVYVNPLSYMLTKDLKGKNLDENLEKIDKVLSIDILKKYPSYSGTPCFFAPNSCVKSNYTKKEYKEFQKAYFVIIKDNFGLFLNTKYLNFIDASRIKQDYFTTFNIEDKTIFGDDLRKNVLKIIEGRSSSDSEINIFNRAINNLFIPILGLLVVFVISIFIKNLRMFLLSGMIIGNALIVFLTAPADYFMYYYNVFLIGNFLIVFYLLKTLLNVEKK